MVPGTWLLLHFYLFFAFRLPFQCVNPQKWIYGINLLCNREEAKIYLKTGQVKPKLTLLRPKVSEEISFLLVS